MKKVEMMSESCSLWKLLGDYEVVIPVIQRDYAQGRKGKEYIRRKFLTDIKEYLNSERILNLDFIYGSFDDKRFYPLDGQQRLTTLWLVHWYISLKSGKLSEDKEILKKFFYETRTSSEDFCKAICDIDIEPDKQGSDSIVDYIKSQTWFYSSWLQDPTISSMLRTIGGDEDNTDDNIECIFGDTDYLFCRDGLKNGKINFELMPIGAQQLQASDDLYIKMNARGKTLSDFENFKADLVDWIRNPSNEEKMLFEQTVDDSSGKTYIHHYPAQIDNDWMDVFWNSTRERLESNFKGRIDDVYFSFFNRYVLNQMCLDDDMNPDEFAADKEKPEHESTKKGFDKLNGTGLGEKGKSDDSLVKYESFDVYKRYMTFDVMKKLDDMFTIIKSNSGVLKVIDSTLNRIDADDESEDQSNLDAYTFIPRYDSDEQKLVRTSLKERVYFFAITSFIDSCRGEANFSEQKFNKWMRVVRNLIENAGIDNLPAMVTCMRKIKDLSDKMPHYSNDIYETLKAYSKDFSESQLEQQLKEEKTKAEKILSTNNDEGWEKKIVEAEDYAFFNGTIRFLYLSDLDKIDWDNFEVKFECSKQLFEEKDVDKKTVNKLLKQFSKFSEIEDKYLFTTTGNDPRKKCWKKDILCSNDPVLFEKVQGLLMNKQELEKRTDEYESFINSGLIDKITSQSDNYKYRYKENFKYVYKERDPKQGVYVFREHKSKCEELNKQITSGSIELLKICENKEGVYNSYINGYYWGQKVYFKDKKKNYVWEVEKGQDLITEINIEGTKIGEPIEWKNVSDLMTLIGS